MNWKKFSILVLVVSLGFIYTLRTSSIDAKSVLRRAMSHGNGLGQGQMKYFQSRVTYRSDESNRSDESKGEPKDPYHKKLSENISNEIIADNWIVNNNGLESLTIEKDAKHGTLINIFYSKGNKVIHYDGIQNQYIEMTTDMNRSSGNIKNDDAIDIEVVNVTDWNDKGWKISKSASFSSSESYGSVYAAHVEDINTSNTKYQWIVDYDTNELIGFDLIADDAGKSKVLQSVRNTKPIIDNSSKIPYSIHDLIPKNALHLDKQAVQVDKAPSLATGDIKGFTIFTPHYDGIKNVSTYMSKDVKNPVGVFDIHQASSIGLALESIYTPFPQEEGKAFVVIQGNKEKIIPLMRNTLPEWTKSSQQDMNIDGNTYTAWIMEGGKLDSEPKQIVVIIEIDNTLLYVIGQGYTHDSVYTFVQSLSVSN